MVEGQPQKLEDLLESYYKNPGEMPPARIRVTATEQQEVVRTQTYSKDRFVCLID